jgi:hypothetical protein
MKRVYQELSSMIQARLNNLEDMKRDNLPEETEKLRSYWFEEWEKRILETVKNGPSGSGIDSGTEITLDKSIRNKLVFHTAYHHMNDGGMYDGWTEHNLIVTPDLCFGFNLKITGRDRNYIKDYLHEVYSEWLNEEIADPLPKTEEMPPPAAGRINEIEP